MFVLDLIRGVGCIFTEMVAGQPTFPGMKDAYDQLDRIWSVSDRLLNSLLQLRVIY